MNNDSSAACRIGLPKTTQPDWLPLHAAHSCRSLWFPGERLRPGWRSFSSDVELRGGFRASAGLRRDMAALLTPRMLLCRLGVEDAAGRGERWPWRTVVATDVGDAQLVRVV